MDRFNLSPKRPQINYGHHDSVKCAYWRRDWDRDYLEPLPGVPEYIRLRARLFSEARPLCEKSDDELTDYERGMREAFLKVSCLLDEEAPMKWFQVGGTYKSMSPARD